nr:tRNA-modifying protein YgfZ [Betaproteobacteria bacterium]
QGKFIPQSLNLDLMNAINFKKGCYTGQEIIARTHYLGTVKKRLYRGYCSASKTFLELGDDILVDGISVGQVIDYSYDKYGAAILCEMKIESVKSKCFLRDNPINIIDEST